MMSIREEINEIVSGQTTIEDSVLRNAPHTVSKVTNDNWGFKYSREKAAYPLSWIKENKFWPASGRVNDAFGDRNLICSCAPISEYEE